MRLNLKKEKDIIKFEERCEKLKKEGAIIDLTKKLFNRSLDANALYWLWMKCLEDETGQPKEDFHDYFKDKYIGVYTKIVFNKTIIKEPTTTDKNTREMYDYMQSVKHESYHDFEVTLPEKKDLGFEDFLNRYYRN